MTDDVRKLLGGYATGTLSDEEKQALFAAALEDDALFAALADEEALRELLDEGAARAQLLRAAEEQRFSIRAALADWFDRPKAKVLVGTMAVLVVAIGVTTYRQQPQPSPSAQRSAPPSLVVAIPRKEAPAAPAASSAVVAAKPRPRRAAPGTQALTSGATTVEYSVLHDAPGTRVQVTANEPGTVKLMSGRTVSASGPVQPGLPVVLGTPVNAETVTLTFYPLGTKLTANTLLPEGASARTREERQAADAAPAAEAAPAPALSVEIPLRPKKP